MDITFVTASDMPKPDPETYLLVEALDNRGVSSQVLAWDSKTVWDKSRLVVIRSPWDYYDRLYEFLSWAKHVDDVSRLVNPFSVVQWNCHKKYMLDLSDNGVPTVPTILFQKQEKADIGSIISKCSWKEVVIKPAVSVGAIGALRNKFDEESTKKHLTDLLDQGDALMQPFISSVLEQGEISMIYFDGKYSHAIQKLPKQGDYRVQDHHGGTVHKHTPTSDEYEVAQAALKASPQTPTYARVDLVRLDHKPVVMELELIEPELFLPHEPKSVECFINVLLRLVDNS